MDPKHVRECQDEKTKWGKGQNEEKNVHQTCTDCINNYGQISFWGFTHVLNPSVGIRFFEILAGVSHCASQLDQLKKNHVSF
jgi:hypothetical protein